MPNPASPPTSRKRRTPAGRMSDQSRRKVATTNAASARTSRDSPSRAKRVRMAPRRRLSRAATGAIRSARGLTLADLHRDGLGSDGTFPEGFRGGVAAGEHGAQTQPALLREEAGVDGALQDTWMSYVQADQAVGSGPGLLHADAARVERTGGAFDDQGEILGDVAGLAEGQGGEGVGFEDQVPLQGGAG